MGLLSTHRSATAFSSYVTFFGLSLLVSSIIYLNRLDNSLEQHTCLSDNLILNITYSVVPTCAQFSHWRTAAIVGIIIGVIDVLIVPFLILSCCMCCIACGVAMCCTDCCKCVSHIFDAEDTTTSDATRNGDEASRMQPESSSPTKRSQRYDVSVKSEPEPSKSKKLINALAWILWVLSPFLATLYIVTSLYRFDAIRSRNIDLYNPALALFVIALFNLMVYFQQFVNSLCGYGHDKVTTESK